MSSGSPVCSIVPKKEPLPKKLKTMRFFVLAFAFPPKKRGVVSRSSKMKIDVDEPSHIIQLFARKVHQTVLVFRTKKLGGRVVLAE